MNKTNVILFNITERCQFYSDFVKQYKDSSKYNVSEFSDLRKAQSYISELGNCIFLFHVSSKDHLKAAVTLLKVNKELQKKNLMKSVCVTGIQNKKVENVLARNGCHELMDPETPSKKLVYKIDFWARPISIALRSETKSGELALKKQISQNTEDALTQAEFKFVSPLNLMEDFWILKSKLDYKRVIKTYLIRLLGPSPHIGKWFELDSEEDEIPTWKFVPDNPDDKSYESENGAWFFVGLKPEFDWKIKRWLFSSERPHLYFYESSGNVFSKFKFEDKQVQISETSNIAYRREADILQTCSSDFSFANDRQDESSSKSLSRDDNKVDKNLEGNSSTDDLGDSQMEGKGSTDEVRSDPLRGKGQSDKLEQDPLRGKSSTDDLSSDPLAGNVSSEAHGKDPLRGKGQSDKLKQDPLRGKSSTDDLSSDPLAGNVSSEAHGKDPLRGKGQNDKLNQDPLSGKSSTDDLSSDPLAGDVSSEAHGKDPLRGKGQNDKLKQDPLRGKSSTDDLSLDPLAGNVSSEAHGKDPLSGKSSTDDLSSDPLAGDVSSEAHGKDPLRGKSITDDFTKDPLRGKNQPEVDYNENNLENDPLDTKEKTEEVYPIENVRKKAKKGKQLTDIKYSLDPRDLEFEEYGSDTSQKDKMIGRKYEPINKHNNIPDQIEASLLESKEEASELNLESGILKVLVSEKNSEGSSAKVSCELVDFYEEELTIMCLPNQFKIKDELDIEIQLIYSSNHVTITTSGNILEVEESDDKNIVVISLSEIQQKDFEEFMELYTWRQENISDFMKQVKGF